MTELELHPKFEAFLDGLERVKRSGRGYVARCPAHEDSEPSLSVIADERGIGLYCFAGCSVESILDKQGLTWADLFFDDSKPVRSKPRRRDWRAIELESYACAARLQHEPKVLERMRFGRGWAAKAFELLHVGWDGSRLTLPVRDSSWKLHDVLRYDPFAKARKILAGRGKSRLPWPPPERVNAEVCFLVEGEGTAISMTSVGLTAVALPGSVSKPTTSIARPGSWQGAGWHRKWTERFARFNEVILLPDCDEQGRALMRAASYDLTKANISNHVIDIGPKTTNGSDIADHLLSKAYDAESRKIARNVIREMVAEHAEVLVT